MPKKSKSARVTKPGPRWQRKRPGDRGMPQCLLMRVVTEESDPGALKVLEDTRETVVGLFVRLYNTFGFSPDHMGVFNVPEPSVVKEVRKHGIAVTTIEVVNQTLGSLWNIGVVLETLRDLRKRPRKGGA